MTTAKTVLSNSGHFRLAVLALVVAATATAATAQTYTDLFNFSRAGGPNEPFLSVIAQGRDGSLYTTSEQGSPGDKEMCSRSLRRER
jgi:hypothetical protein